MKKVILLICILLIASYSFARKPPADWEKIDPDAEKVLVISDFESEDEIWNKDSSVPRPDPGKLKNKYPIWIGSGKTARWTSHELKISDKHVRHGKHSLEAIVYENVKSGHAFTPMIRHSIPADLKDWSDYDEIRFFVHVPKEQPKTKYLLGVNHLYKNKDGKEKLTKIHWLNFTMKPGDSSLAIPLYAFDNPTWQGPIGGYGGGKNQSYQGKELFTYFRDLEYGEGWSFDKVTDLWIGLHGGYDNTIRHHYWIDYIRLVKKKE